MNRFGAFLIHLGISLVIFAVLAYLVLYVWYPDFFFASDGGWQGMRIIVFVDLVLGPLLTLVVFNRNKPATELRRDLTIIGTFQLCCLAAGTWIVYQERPLALVYLDGQFFSMTLDDYTSLGMPSPDLDRFPGPYPKRLTVALPEGLAEQSRVRQRAFAEGKPLRAYAELYEPLTKAGLNIEREAFDTTELQKRSPDLLEDWVERHDGKLQDYAFFPFGARYGYIFLGVERASGELAGVLDIPRLVPGKPTKMQVPLR